MHECPARGCTEQVPRSRLTCREHWYRLPGPLRAAINATWRNRKRDGLGPWSANVLEARRLLAEPPAGAEAPADHPKPDAPAPTRARVSDFARSDLCAPGSSPSNSPGA